ncbi:hypothetical protein METBIDRAFT_87570 [Metschnikowia bicuspidata var. bicuspidata NRRL YB-4993]|uniref:Amino acid permease/ SLC12A domain-containing protein n=1 Tax=Metschnikowia bicuspidata var. bicuspidata NRRL YB-4993 TaxID=869754 RepID=A0A1A0HC47_9ASCO|nr:hypothetical protein METBIDRAFT_87570 [Metschnikowia bicuspidata var. bicuspidata NRRL YB-4993]OBA21463.1 hypothetical protein METBIDRAFT_87570 [Metschnikowia bicuspidata var. bicuspidata NRRL YB-4993]
MGSALNAGGPVGLIAGFAIVGILVMIVMFCIGELSCVFDFNFSTHASRWGDPAFGASMGWFYVFLWICNIIAEYVSVIAVLSYYSSRVPLYGYFLILWPVFSLYQMFGVDVFGEVEYVLAFIKILFISGFYLFSIIYASGGIDGYKPENVFKAKPLAGGFKGIANSFVYAGVFYTGIESLSVTLSELKNVRSAVKSAVRQAIFRIFYVYFGISIAFGITVAYDDPMLSSENKTMQSPIAIYFAARSLKRLADDGVAPTIFCKVTKQGVPWVATQAVHIFGFLALLSISSGSKVAYSYIVNLGVFCAFIVWTAIVYRHYRFRKGWLSQGRLLGELPFKVPLFPFLNYLGISLGIVLVLVQGWLIFKPFDAGNFVDYYIMVPLFFICYIFYDSMDFDTDRSETEGMADEYSVKKVPWAKRLWESI